MNGAVAVVQLALEVECFASGAVQAGVFVFVDEPFVIDFGEDFLRSFDVFFLGGADERVVAEVELVAEFDELL